MILFITSAIVICIAAILFVVLPLLKGQESKLLSRDKVIELYQRRVRELEIDRNNLDADQYSEMLLIAQRQMLDDLQHIDPDPEKTVANNRKWLPILLAILIPVSASALYLPLGGGKQAMAWKIPPMTEPSHISLEVLTELEQKLEQGEATAYDWHLLGKAYVIQQEYLKARKAYARAIELEPMNIDILTDHAEVLLLTSESPSRAEVMTLLERAGTIDPDHPKLLWLRTVVASYDQDRDGQIRNLQRLLEVLPADASERTQLQAILTELLKGEATTDAQETGTVTVKLTIPEPLRAAIGEHATVYVFARAIEGPRMPLAVARYPYQQLPLEIVLDDSMAIPGGAKLSDFPEVEVVALVSHSGNAQAQSGDLKGQVAPVNSANSATVTIEINELIP